MGADTFTATDTDKQVCLDGVLGQAKAHGLDMDDPKVVAFCEHTAAVKAASMAECRFLTNVVDKVTFQGHWAPGGCKHVHKHVEEVK